MMLETFNEYFKTLPFLKKDVIYQIEIADWEERKKEQALRILNATTFELETSSLIGYPHIEFKRLELSFDYEECSVEDGDILGLDQYIEELCASINALSPALKFSLSGHRPFKNCADIRISITF